MQVTPYLSFEGRAEEALDFYRQALGAEVPVLMRYSDNPEPAAGGPAPPGSEHKVMHAEMRIGETLVMCSDGACAGEARFGGITLALRATDDAHARRLFDALAVGGRVQMPLSRTFFSSSFGMLSDRFGVPWMVVTET